MAKSGNLASMSVDALLKLRDDISATLSRRADDLKNQLSRLAGGAPKRGRPPGRKGPSKGSKVAAKYRGPNGETWSGRGLKPRWMTAAISDGKKAEDFLIAQPARKGGAKKKRGRKKKAA
jgi:DNA-binding protein H-NS